MLQAPEFPLARNEITRAETLTTQAMIDQFINDVPVTLAEVAH